MTISKLTNNIHPMDEVNKINEIVDGTVEKAGDTMTGRLEIDYASATDDSPLTIKSTNLDFDTTESAVIYPPMIRIEDANGNRMGQLQYMKRANGGHYISIVDKENSSSTDYAQVNIGWESDGLPIVESNSNIYIKKSNPRFVVRDSRLVMGTNASENFYPTVANLEDKNGVLFGGVNFGFQTTGKHYIYLQCRNNDNTDWAVLQVGYDANNNAYCNFPDTTCCDGQWVQKAVTIADNVNVNGTTKLTYTLSDLPSGSNYEVMISANVTTGSTSGNTVTAQITSDLQTNWVNIARARTRTASTMVSSGTVIIPVSSSKKIYLTRDSDYNGSVTLYLRAYRRIGTNS